MLISAKRQATMVVKAIAMIGIDERGSTCGNLEMPFYMHFDLEENLLCLSNAKRAEPRRGQMTNTFGMKLLQMRSSRTWPAQYRGLPWQ